MQGPSSPDVVVVGGGPAGSVASTLLADAGHRVVLLEREKFPRYHIGESLLSATLPIFDAIGATPKIEAHGFLRKPGGTFQWGRSREPWSFLFREDPGGRPYGFQVVRAEFDELLLRNAAEHDVEVREEHTVTHVDVSGSTPFVDVRRVDGRELRFTPRFVVDASGQGSVIGRALGVRRFDEFFKNLAVFGYFRDAERLPGELANNVFSCAFGDGWFWYIPLHDGTMSVGAVIDVKRWHTIAETHPVDTLRKLIARCEPIASRLRHATLLDPVRIIRDYSYDSTTFRGRGWVLAGDAACFIDPVFSTGVHLASLAGFFAARAISGVLRGVVDEETALARYDAQYREAFRRYLRFVYFFYDHNVDADSYFWTARRLLAHQPDDIDLRGAFVRLVSGGGDRAAMADFAAFVGQEHDRWDRAIRAGRVSALPGNELLRVRTTQRLLDDDEE